MNNLENELRSLLNRYSAENDSHTPDFILSQYLGTCLQAFNVAVQQRENWYGRDPRPLQEKVEELPERIAP
jgi:hypothetical protein